MAMIRKCDRCGKEISLEGRAPMILNYRRVIESRIMFYFRDSYRIEKAVDLCKECDDSFIDWFDAGAESRKLKT